MFIYVSYVHVSPTPIPHPDKKSYLLETFSGSTHYFICSVFYELNVKKL